MAETVSKTKACLSRGSNARRSSKGPYQDPRTHDSTPDVVFGGAGAVLRAAAQSRRLASSAFDSSAVHGGAAGGRSIATHHRRRPQAGARGSRSWPRPATTARQPIESGSFSTGYAPGSPPARRGSSVVLFLLAAGFGVTQLGRPGDGSNKVTTNTVPIVSGQAVTVFTLSGERPRRRPPRPPTVATEVPIGTVGADDHGEEEAGDDHDEPRRRTRPRRPPPETTTDEPAPESTTTPTTGGTLARPPTVAGRITARHRRQVPGGHRPSLVPVGGVVSRFAVGGHARDPATARRAAAATIKPGGRSLGREALAGRRSLRGGLVGRVAGRSA